MIDRSLKPVEQLQFKFSPPAIDHFTLDNGLKVYFVERRHLPVIRINLMIDAGSKFDPEEKKGLANLLTMTFDEGAGDLNGLELSDEFELLGSNFDSGCNHDNIFLSLRSLKENFGRSLELFSDVLLRPHLDEISFAREKRKIMTRVSQLKDEPDEIANRVFEFIVFGKDDTYAYPTSGYESTIINIQPGDVKLFYNHYIVPNNAALVVTGDIGRTELIDILNKRFSKWDQGTVITLHENQVPQHKFQIYMVNKEDSVQSEIRAGHFAGSRDNGSYLPKVILNSILGGQFSSRINLNLRENKGYTYGASTNFNFYKEKGYFIASTSVSTENTLNAVIEIIKELTVIREGVTPEELSFTRSSILRKFPSNFETNRQISVNLSRLILHSLPLDYFDTYPDKVNAVTLHEVNQTAADCIYPEDLTIVITGDKKSILPVLNGLGPIIELDINGKIIF